MTRLGAERFGDYAARQDVAVSRPMAAGLVAAAHDALPTPGAAVARDVLAADLALLEDLADQLGATEARITALLLATAYQILTTTPGWGVIRAASYAAVLGTSSRWAFRRPQHSLTVTVWMSISPPFTCEAIMESGQVYEVISVLEMAREEEEAKKMTAVRSGGTSWGHLVGAMRLSGRLRRVLLHSELVACR